MNKISVHISILAHKSDLVDVKVSFVSLTCWVNLLITQTNIQEIFTGKTLLVSYSCFLNNWATHTDWLVTMLFCFFSSVSWNVITAYNYSVFLFGSLSQLAQQLAVGDYLPIYLIVCFSITGIHQQFIQMSLPSPELKRLIKSNAAPSFDKWKPLLIRVQCLKI